MTSLKTDRDKAIEVGASALAGEAHTALILILEAVTASRDPAERQALLAGLQESLSQLP